MLQLQGSEKYIWSLGECLGQGSSAAVYRGRHKRTGELCAVKVFKNDGRFRPEIWENELEILRNLVHPNIIHVAAIETESMSKTKVLIMELCTSSVWGMLEDPKYAKGFTETEFLTVLNDVADGMRYLRDNDISHRDIKPGNIMRVLSEDNRSIYKLADFGAARTLTDDANFMTLCGTEEYLHPDLYGKAVMRKDNVQQFTASVDLWSLGASFYHIATGELPFKPFGGRNNTTIMFQMTTNKPIGSISACQLQEGGRIVYSKELPETCLLSMCLKRQLVPLLAGLLENDNDNTWNFDQFFIYVEKLRKMLKFNVYDASFGTNRLLYVPPESKLKDVQELIAKHTDIDSRNQVLINTYGIPLSEYVAASAAINSYPRLVMEMQFFVYSCEPVDRFPPEVIDLPPVPSFASIFQYSRDSEIANNCAALSHFTKNVVQITVESQSLLCDSITALKEHLKRNLNNVRQQVLSLQNDYVVSHHIYQRFQTDHRALMQVTDQLLQHKTDDVLTSRTALDFITSSATLPPIPKFDVNIKKCEKRLTTLTEQFNEPHNTVDLYNSSCCVEKMKCVGKVEHQIDWIMKICSRFRRDKNTETHTYNDEQIHKMERIKLRDRIAKVYYVYIEHCQKKMIRIHGDSYSIVRSLCDLSKNVDLLNEKVQSTSLKLQKMSGELKELTAKYDSERQLLLTLVSDCQSAQRMNPPSLRHHLPFRSFADNVEDSDEKIGSQSLNNSLDNLIERATESLKVVSGIAESIEAYPRVLPKIVS